MSNPYFKLTSEIWKDEPDYKPTAEIANAIPKASKRMREAMEFVTNWHPKYLSNPIIALLRRYDIEFGSWPLRALFFYWAYLSPVDQKLCGNDAIEIIRWLQNRDEKDFVDHRVIHLFLMISYTRIENVMQLQSLLLPLGKLHWRTFYQIICDGKYCANDVGWVLDHINGADLDIEQQHILIYGTLFLKSPGKFETWDRHGIDLLKKLIRGINKSGSFVRDDDFFDYGSYEKRPEQIDRFKRIIRHRLFTNYRLDPRVVAKLVYHGEGETILDYLRARQKKKSGYVWLVYKSLLEGGYGDFTAYALSLAQQLGLRDPITMLIAPRSCNSGEAFFTNVIIRTRRCIEEYAQHGYRLWSLQE